MRAFVDWHRVQTEYGDGEWMIDGDGKWKSLTVRTPNAILETYVSPSDDPAAAARDLIRRSRNWR